MSNGETLFDLPNIPDDFGVILPSSNLRRFDFSGLDYDTSRRAIIEYIRTYFPDDFNDFVASNGVIMFMEILASTTAKLSLRQDIIAGNSFLPTAKSEAAVVNHLALINQRIKRQTPAVIDIECSVDRPLFTNLQIPARTKFAVTGPDNTQIFYEIYRAPNDWNSSIVIPANKRGVIAWGIEGQFASPVVEVSVGGANQQYEIVAKDVLEAPIFVEVTLGDVVEEWTVITEPIERYGPTDRVVEVNFIEDRILFRFGDNITGRQPVAGSTIQFTYRIGGGKRGRIGINQISTTRQFVPDSPANAATSVNFRNITPSSGGTNKETIDQAKKRAPRDFAIQKSIVTASDYAQAASSFSHPVFGAITKTVATIRTGYNANRVEIYALAEGEDNLPVLPSAGLKTGLATYFSNLNVLSDHVVILDGELKPVDIVADVIMDRNADASVIKTKVEFAIDDFFGLENWDMGKPFFISDLISVVKSIDGVAYINLFEPVNNILETGEISSVEGVGINQLIVQGSRKTNYYYDKVRQ